MLVGPEPMCSVTPTRSLRVLDVGTGAGAVAFLAARIVGEAGEVVGIDLDEAAIEKAAWRQRLRLTSTRCSSA